MSENVVRTDVGTLQGDVKVDGTLEATGDTTLTGALNANGGIACDTNKFTVADTTGNVATAGDLAVTGDTTLTGGLHLTVQTVTVPSAAAAAEASRILTTATVIRLNAENDANDVAYLPSPTNVSTGKVYILVTDGTGCELSSEGDGTTATTINGVAVTNAGGAFAKELALAASGTFIAIKTGDNAWTVTGGTPN